MMKLCDGRRRNKSVFVVVVVVILGFLVYQNYESLCVPFIDRQCMRNLPVLLEPEKHVNNRYEMATFRKINWGTRTDEALPKCTWANGESLYLPDSNDALEQMMITWVNEFNVTYTLHAGPLLGALRHQGKIKDDYDLDMLFPLWLNFGCSDKNRNNFSDNYNKLCNSSTPHSVKIDLVISNFNEQIRKTSAPFYTVKMPWGGFRLWRKKLRFYEQNFYSDILVVSESGKYKEWFQGGTCKCWYRSVPAQCVEPAMDVLMHTFKQTSAEILTPMVFADQRRGSRNAYKDESVKNPFHPRWNKT